MLFGPRQQSSLESGYAAARLRRAIVGIFQPRRAWIDGAERAEEGAVGQGDGHRNVTLKAVHRRRVMAVEYLILGHVIDHHGLMALPDLVTDRGFQLQLATGFQSEWRTLEAIQKTEAIDVWYLVSLSGLFRQATRDAEHLDQSKRAALTRMIGTPDWEKDWYRQTSRTNLFGDTDERMARTAEVDDMESYFGSRLRDLFPKVLPPLRLNDFRGIPQFALFLRYIQSKACCCHRAGVTYRWSYSKIWHFIERAAVKGSTSRLLVFATPLLEEKRRP
jgi:hypothetical protein